LGMKSRIALAFIFALFLDVADIIAFAWIPVIGDVLDIIGIVILFILVRNPIVLISASELIPGVDFLPMHTVAVALSQKNILKKFTKSKRGVARSEFILAGVVSMAFLSVYQFALQDLVLNLVGVENGIGQLFLGNFMVWLFSIAFTFALLRQIKKKKRQNYESS